MSSKVCPKTCGQLSTAAVFISIGVIQFLAGIILLKSEYVYLLAGIDFLAAISNASVSVFLGITSSMWENKPKQMTGKKIARQNILAGLYITVMVVNATTAIIMVMGDGNKLLTIPENVDRNNSAVFVLEIMACAYVTSVCSPIVCIVVALVCLSGNRIQIHENMKERESIAKTESYGWVFQNNHGNGPKKLSDIIHSPLNMNSSGSDDVFLDEKCCLSKKSLFQKFSKKSHSRNSISSPRELQSPLEIWNHKRKKILQEITEPKRVFFSDDYLQFPDFNYGPYMETILPRVKQTSLMHPRSGENRENKHKSPRKTLHSQSDEVDSKLSDRSVKSYKDKTFLNSTNPTEETDSMKRYYSIQYKNENCRQISTDGHSTRPLAPNRYSNSPSYSFSDRNLKLNSTLANESDLKNLTSVQKLSHIQVENQVEVPNSITSPACAIKSEAVDKFDELSFDDTTTIGDRREFMKSFKVLKEARAKKCDSDLQHENEISKNTSGVISAENSASDEIQKSTSWAGVVVPITVRSTTISPGSGIPVATTDSRITECQSTSEDLSTSDTLKESLRNSSIYQKTTTGSFEFPQTATSLYDGMDKLKKWRSLDLHPHKISSPTLSETQDVIRGRSIMSSIPESPMEEAIPEDADDETFVSARGNPEFKMYRANTCKTTATRPKHNKLKSTQSTHLLKRLWSSVGHEDKTDISNLIMDMDSLVGLSDEELMNRTGRLREIRKSVIMRSKNEA